ncbi:MAG: phosphatase PAP2 family protein [Chloroflexi bacterium]|nr:phosphatase PAP2 family protein [Chloroflexota bacterium]
MEVEVLEQADQAAFLWLNGWVGRFPSLDNVVRLLASDYLVPLLLALTLLGLWFTGPTLLARTRNQHGVMAAVVALALASLVVEVISDVMFRPRPFATLDVSLLFYRPTDSSFPAHIAAIGFAVAIAVLLWNRRAGAALVALAALYSLSRVYAGVLYPLDIVGGAAIGVAGGLAATLLLRRFRPIPAFVLRVARALYLA